MQQMSLEWAPAVAGHPHLSAARTVHFPRHPADREFALRGFLWQMSGIHHAVEAAFLDPVNGALGRPRAFVVAGGDFVVRPNAHSVGRAEAGGADFAFASVIGS